MQLEKAVRAVDEIKCKPLSASFGAEIEGVDLVTADLEVQQAVVALLRKHGAIMLRGQKLSAEEQVNFTKLFGAPADNIHKQFTVAGSPDVFVISNRVVDGRRIGQMDAGSGWHTDMAHVERPADVTILHALEVPKDGSDTLLADLCAAWNALPPERQEALDGLQILHSYEQLAKKKRLPMTEEQIAKVPPVWHPMVRRHPADGRKTLYICTGTVKEVTGMEPEAGIEMVNELVEFATQEQFLYRHKWQAGDVLVWDNACTLHRGTPFDSENEIRTVHRTWVVGDKTH
jgi:taurine dioxygenase